MVIWLNLKWNDIKFSSRGGQAYFVYQPHSGRYAPCEIDDAKNPMNTDFKTDAGMWLKPRNLFGESER